MTRETWCEARTQGAPLCRHIGATEDAASRCGAPVRRPGSLCGQAPKPPETSDEEIAQDPGIPGFDVMSDPGDEPLPDEKEAGAEERERLDDPDYEGQMTGDE